MTTSCADPQLLLLLWLVIEDHDNLFVMAEVVHFLGIGVLLYKLTTKRNAGGARALCWPPARTGSSAACLRPLRRRATQLARRATDGAGAPVRRPVAAVAGAHSPLPGRAALLQVRPLAGPALAASAASAEVRQAVGSCVCPHYTESIVCTPLLMGLRYISTATRSFMMEYDIHTVLDFLTLVATVWVIYELRFPLADTYQKDQDTIQAYYVVRCDARAPAWGALLCVLGCLLQPCLHLCGATSQTTVAEAASEAFM